MGLEDRRYLDIWAAKKLGISNEEELTREDIDSYTRKKLKETVEYVAANSSFYSELFSGHIGKASYACSESCQASGNILAWEKNGMPGEDFMELFRTLPFTYPGDLRDRGLELLCAGPGEISRVVTLDTGGSTGKPKRIYFTEEDQQLTVDYFQHGMQLIVNENDKVLILMPARVPGSIGRLLGMALENLGIETVEYGLPGGSRHEMRDILHMMAEEKVTSAVALPTHMRMLAELLAEEGTEERAENGNTKADHGESASAHDKTDDATWDVSRSSRSGNLKLSSVLLSAEYVDEADIRLIGDAFGCRVYEHYGMTEMGLGCAVSCGHGDGYHIREPDLYIEIIDPETGETIEDERPGEIVFTTLTRKGMPFVRYRTGDRSHWINKPCRCGSVLRRIAKVGRRSEMKGYLR